MKPMKVQPPEFAKAINDRAKLTFYEVMASSSSGAPAPPTATATATGYSYGGGGGGSPHMRPSSASARAGGGASPLHLPNMNGRQQQPQVFTPKARRLTIDR